MIRYFLAALALLPTTPVTAQSPSVFIKTDNSAFWSTSDAPTGRVVEQQAGPVTSAKLTTFIENDRQYGSLKVCALSAVGQITFVGVDKQSQDEITNYHKAQKLHYRVAARTPDGRRVVGLSVLFEECESDLKGAALLVYDELTGEVLKFEEATSETDNNWFLFLEPNTDATNSMLFSYSHCQECGSATAIYYDVTRRRIYSEYNGH